VTGAPRLVADFNYGGLVDDEGRVYLKPDTLADLASAGIEPREDMALTLSDYDGTEDEPLWLVAEGVMGYDAVKSRWYLDYRRQDVRWESRAKDD
jgi:hypothetical protein